MIYRPLITGPSVLEAHPDYVRAIGMVNVEINNMELSLAFLLSAILDTDPEIGQAIYLTPKAAFARLEILQNVAEGILGPVEGIVDADGLYKSLRRLTEKSGAVLGKR